MQPARSGDDYTSTNAALAIITFVGVDVLLGLVMHQVPWDRTLDAVPTVLVRDGTPVTAARERSRVNIDDIMEVAPPARARAFRRRALRRVRAHRGMSVIPRRS